MPKQGQHKHDRHDHRLVPATGRTNPRKSTAITTGTPKKRETYARQYREHENPAKPAQRAEKKWDPDTRHYVTHEADSHVRALDRKKRSGSDSNTSTDTRGY